MLRHFLLVGCLLVLTATMTTAAEIEAPFKLRWGMSVEEVEQIGTKMTETNEGIGKSFYADGIDTSLGDTRSIQLSFDLNNKLLRILVVSDDFKVDPLGENLMRRYAEINKILEKKYGKGEVYHKTDKIYSDPIFFFENIMKSRSHYFTTYTKGDLYLENIVDARSMAMGYYKLDYRNTRLIEEYKSGNITNGDEGDAL